jgi:hypothetical protein
MDKNTKLYFYLGAAGIFAYLLLRRNKASAAVSQDTGGNTSVSGKIVGESDITVVSDTTGGNTNSNSNPVSSTPRTGCNGYPFMPRSKAWQLQLNLNAYFNLAGTAECDVDGYFGYWTARSLDYYIDKMREHARDAQNYVGEYNVLKDVIIFEPLDDSDLIIFDLYQDGCDLIPYGMRQSLYDKLTSPDFIWTYDDKNIAGLLPALPAQ